MPKKQNLKNLFTTYQKAVDSVIKKVLLNNVDRHFHSAAFYQISTGGKRLRPALAILSCQLLGGKKANVLYPSAGLEILHNYTLIIDDIIDHGLVRRNLPTTQAKYGKSMAECIAIDYAASIFQTAPQCPNPADVSRIFAETIKTVNNGQVLDILFERADRKDEPYFVKNRPKVITLNNYLKMISKKTAALLSASCEIGAVCAKANQSEIKQLKDYGFNLGMAFQAQDDILDMFGKKKDFGKKIGKDIEERKGGNLVLLYAKQELNSQQKKRINSIMKKPKIIQKDINLVLSLIKKTTARQKSAKTAEQFAEKARQALRQLPQNQHNQTLTTLADFTVSRSI